MNTTQIPWRHDASSRIKVLGLAALLCILGVWAYRSSFRTPFLFDDLKLIGDRVVYYADGNLKPLLVKTRRPMLHLSFAANYWRGGLDPRGYHVFNLAVHLIGTLALFGVVRRTLLLASIPDRLRSVSTGLAFSAAALWMLHPLQTESVTYIVQRCESMMGMFYLLCLYCILRGSQSTRGYLWYLAAILFFHCGLGSKEVMITALVVLPLYDRVFLSANWKEVWKRRWALYAGLTPLIIWFALGLVRTFDSTPTTSIGFGVQAVTPWGYLRSQPGVILYYLRLAAWPDGLCLDYLWPVANDPLKIYPAGAVILGLLIGCVAGLWFFPRLAFLGLSFFLILAPTSSFVPIVNLAFEHRMYLPLAPLIILAVVGIYWSVTHWVKSAKDQRLFCGIAVTVVMLAFMMKTNARNLVYADHVKMWNDVVSKSPQNYSAYNNLAMHLARRGYVQEAIAAYEKSIKINPRFAKTHDNFGNLFARQQQYQEAAKRYRQAIATDPTYERAYTHLGIVLYEQGKTEEAIQVLQQALQVDPRSIGSARRLAWIRATAPDDQLRNAEEAVKLAEQARTLTGDQDFRTLEVLAAAYAEAGRFDEAVRMARLAVQEAKQAGEEDSASQTQQQLDCYQAGQPFRAGQGDKAPG